jgi:hypothetical protein
MRAVEVLERIASTEAREVLDRLVEDVTDLEIPLSLTVHGPTNKGVDGSKNVTPLDDEHAEKQRGIVKDINDLIKARDASKTAN